MQYSFDASAIPLILADATEIAALAELTKPGPFFPEMMAMGPFMGVRADGQLVAVAGQCIHLTGYAALLVRHTARDIFVLGEIPFLHVLPENHRTRRLYERLGFRVRREMAIIVVGR